MPVLLAALGQWELWTRELDVLRGPRPALVVVLVVAAGVLVVRRRAPLLVLLALSVLLLVPSALRGASQLAVPVLALGLGVFCCGRYGARPSVYAALPVGIADVLVLNALDPLTAVADSWPWALNTFWLFGAGAWARQNQQLVEQSRAETQERVRAAAAEERLRIARDLHDVLAHNLTVMVVQAEAATAVAQDQTALHEVVTTGRTALADVRGLLPILRQEQNGTTGGSPARGEKRNVGLAELPKLVQRLEAAGLQVDLRVHGQVHDLPAEVDCCLYRVAQEGLTNALRHAGPTQVLVTVAVQPEQVRLDLCDDGGPAPTADNNSTLTGSGQGVRGMRERVEALGGALTAQAQPQGGFAVRAIVPLPLPRAPAQLSSVPAALS